MSYYHEKAIKRCLKGNPLGCPHRTAAPSSTSTSSPQHFSHCCIFLGCSWTPSATPSPKSESPWLFLWCSCSHGLFTRPAEPYKAALLSTVPHPVAHWNFLCWSSLATAMWVDCHGVTAFVSQPASGVQPAGPVASCEPLTPSTLLPLLCLCFSLSVCSMLGCSLHRSVGAEPPPRPKVSAPTSTYPPLLPMSCALW